MPSHIRSSPHRDGPLGVRRSASAVRSSIVGIAFAVVGAGASSFSCSDRASPPGDDRVRVKLPADLGGDAARDRTDEAADASSGGDGASAPVDPSVGCEVDDDCVRVEKGCCPLGRYIAITKANAAAYQASLGCESKICPMILVVDDHSVAQCNPATHACEVVLPRNVACDGLTTSAHACPTGWRCRPGGDVASGRCVQVCGGFAGIPCSQPDVRCVDDPDDTCDPNAGGADCGGLCLPDTH